jgi:hypothetical protein
LKNKWLSDEPFCIKYNRLFDTSIDKNVLVVEMCRRAWVVGKERWSGGDVFFSASNCVYSVLLFWITFSYKLMCQIIGSEILITIHGTCETYHLLTQLVSIELVVRKDVIWNNFMSFKVSFFAWHLLNNRFPFNT